MFACSIVVCLIGVLTFITGMTGRAKKDGVLEQKINQALAGIQDIKDDLRGVSNNQQSLALLVQSHEEQIKTLFRMTESANTTNKALITMTEVLRKIGEVKE